MVVLTEQEYEQLISNPAEAKRRNLNAYQKVMKGFDHEIREIVKKGDRNVRIIKEAVSAVVRAAFGARRTAAIPESRAAEVEKIVRKTLDIIDVEFVNGSQKEKADTTRNVVSAQTN